MVDAAVDVFGGLHVLFNNAGIFPDDDGGVLDTPPDTWQRVMEVNLKGVWLGSSTRPTGWPTRSP